MKWNVCKVNIIRYGEAFAECRFMCGEIRGIYQYKENTRVQMCFLHLIEFTLTKSLVFSLKMPVFHDIFDAASENAISFSLHSKLS